MECVVNTGLTFQSPTFFFIRGETLATRVDNRRLGELKAERVTRKDDRFTTVYSDLDMMEHILHPVRPLRRYRVKGREERFFPVRLGVLASSLTVTADLPDDILRVQDVLGSRGVSS